MKNSLFYGSAIAFAGFVTYCLAYFLGFQDTPEKLDSTNTLLTVASLAITVVFMVYGVREKRSERPEGEEFSYGSAFGAALLISVVAAVLGAVFNLVFTSFINPALPDTTLALQAVKMRSKGMSEADVQRAVDMTRNFMKPGLMAIFALIGGLFFGTVISLIVAAFLRRKPAPPQVAAS